MNILVTGAGSLVGHGILRSLRMVQDQNFRIVTADPDHRASGHWLADMGVKIPLAKEDHYISRLKEIIRNEKIDIVFVGTDPELAKIAEANLVATVVVSSPEVIAIGEDKWLTVEFLKNNGFLFPASALSENREEVIALLELHGFPLFAKPRMGARSVGAMKVENMEQLNEVLIRPNYIVQEYLPGENAEFTAGTMTYHNKCYSCVIFKRDLKDGNTYRAYTFENQEHERYITDISEKLNGVYGPLNFQYRLKNGKPIIFEINSRFSGTSPLRTAVGVNEIEMALSYFKDGRLSKRKVTLSDVAILRTWSDIIVPMTQLEEFQNKAELKNPSATYFPFLSR